MEKYLKPALLLVATLAFLSLFYIIFNEKSTRDIDKIVAKGRLRVITDNSTLGFRNEKDSVYGFQYEIVKVFATKFGVELEISENDNVAECVENMLEGEYDLVAALIPITSEYKNKVLYTNPIQVDRQMLVQLVGDSTAIISKHHQLANDTISLPKNSPYKMLIRNLSSQIADTIYVDELKNTTTEVAVKMVADGIINYTLCSESFAQNMTKRYPNLNISLPLGFQQATAWAVPRKSVELHKRLNEFLSDFIGSAEYWEIYRKYY